MFAEIEREREQLRGEKYKKLKNNMGWRKREVEKI